MTQYVVSYLVISSPCASTTVPPSQNNNETMYHLNRNNDITTSRGFLILQSIP